MKRTEMLCPECMKGKLLREFDDKPQAWCDRCGTQFHFTGANTVIYAPAPPPPPAKPKEDGGVAWNGTRCSITAFVDRKKYRPTEKQLAAIKATKRYDEKELPDFNDGSKYEWVQVGDEKYGRFMYCLKTGMHRHQTMGEFYGSGVVD